MNAVYGCGDDAVSNYAAYGWAHEVCSKSKEAIVEFVRNANALQRYHL